jgi:hypothetical protein
MGPPKKILLLAARVNCSQACEKLIMKKESLWVKRLLLMLSVFYGEMMRNDVEGNRRERGFTRQ